MQCFGTADQGSPGVGALERAHIATWYVVGPADFREDSFLHILHIKVQCPEAPFCSELSTIEESIVDDFCYGNGFDENFSIRAILCNLFGCSIV